MTVHVILPDTQAKLGVPSEHLGWAGQYWTDKYAGRDDVKIIHLGDHADMPSLSSYDRGKIQMEGRRYEQDIKAANDAFDVLCGPMDEYNAKQRAGKHVQWNPERHFLHGNHCARITRAIESNPQLEGTVSLDHLNYARKGWIVHPFLEVLTLDGVRMSHYFYQPNTGRPYTGMVETRLKNIGTSFTQGHQQGFMFGTRSVAGKRQNGLIAGSFYGHSEEYRGPQAADEWRGILICNDVRDGSYDLMQVSLDYLARRYGGTTEAKYREKADRGLTRR